MPTSNSKDNKPSAPSPAEQPVERQRTSLIDYLETFPGGELERNPNPSRDVEL